MGQSSITAGLLVIAYIIFVTVRGELPGYLGVLGLGPKPVVPDATARGGLGIASNFTAAIPGSTGGGGGISIGIGGGGGGITIGGGGITIGGGGPVFGGGGWGGWDGFGGFYDGFGGWDGFGFDPGYYYDLARRAQVRRLP